MKTLTDKPKSTIKAVVYDLDATLLDTEPNWLKADRRMLAEYGIDFTQKMKNEYIGKSVGDMLNGLKARHTIDATNDELLEKKNSYYLEIAIGNTHMFPEIEEFYTDAKSRNLLSGIASGTTYEVIIKQLQDLSIVDDFEFILSADHVQNGKPAPDIYIESAKRLHLKPEEILVVEDSPHGVKAAKDAGMNCVAIPYYPDPNNRRKLEDEMYEADVLFEDGMCAFNSKKLFSWIEQS